MGDFEHLDLRAAQRSYALDFSLPGELLCFWIYSTTLYAAVRLGEIAGALLGSYTHRPAQFFSRGLLYYYIRSKIKRSSLVSLGSYTHHPAFFSRNLFGNPNQIKSSSILLSCFPVWTDLGCCASPNRTPVFKCFCVMSCGRWLRVRHAAAVLRQSTQALDAVFFSLLDLIWDKQGCLCPETSYGKKSVPCGMLLKSLLRLILHQMVIQCCCVSMHIAGH